MAMNHCTKEKTTRVARRKIQPSDEQEVIQKYQSGISSEQLAKEYGISATAILNVLRRNKIEMRSGADWKFSEEVRQEIIQRYTDYETIASIAKSIGCSSWFVKDLIRKYGVPTRGTKPRYPDLKHDYFSVIDSPEKAWILGFIATDGCVSGRSLSWALKRADRYILEQIASIICPSVIVTNSFSSDKKMEPQPISRLSFYSKQLCDDLLQYGIHPNKTETVQFWHGVSDSLCPHYLRGIIDGDGCLYTSGTRNHISLCSASKQFLLDVSQSIEKHTGIQHPYLGKRNNCKAWEIKYWKNDNVKKITQWLYQDDSIGLIRKKEIADRFSETVTRQYYDWKNTTLEQLLHDRSNYTSWEEMAESMGLRTAQLKNRVNRLRRLRRGIQC